METERTETDTTEFEVHGSAEQYLTFMLDNEEYGIDILRVQGIQGYGKVTPLPHTPEYVLGVINLRGAIVPIINLRTRFDIETIPSGPTTVVIVVKIISEQKERTIGLMVDAVSEVRDVHAKDRKPTPDFGTAINAEFVSAIATIGDSMLILLDVDYLMNSGEMELLDNLPAAFNS